MLTMFLHGLSKTLSPPQELKLIHQLFSLRTFIFFNFYVLWFLTYLLLHLVDLIIMWHAPIYFSGIDLTWKVNLLKITFCMDVYSFILNSLGNLDKGTGFERKHVFLKVGERQTELSFFIKIIYIRLILILSIKFPPKRVDPRRQLLAECGTLPRSISSCCAW